MGPAGPQGLAGTNGANGAPGLQGPPGQDALAINLGGLPRFASSPNGFSAEEITVTLGRDGLPILAYIQNGAVYVARCTAVPCTQWPAGVLVDNTSWFWELQLATDAYGFPILAYADSLQPHLRYVRCTSPACAARTITTVSNQTGSGGGNTIGLSMASGPQGYGVLSYVDSTSNSLKIVNCRDHTCGSRYLRSVPSAELVDPETSVTVSAAGTPVVFTRNQAGLGLIATCSDFYCSQTSLYRIAGTSVTRPSISVGVDGLPVLTYFNGTSSVLHKCYDSRCSTTAAALALSSSPFTALTIGVDGLPVVAHQQRYQVKVTNCLDADCSSVSTAVAKLSNRVLETGVKLTIGAGGNPIFLHEEDVTFRLTQCANRFCNQFIRRR